MKLRDKVAVITGGGNGIGKETAILFAEQGARIVIADVDCKGGREVEQFIQESGGNAFFLETDTSNSADVARLMNKTVEKFGAIHILCNNAGINQREVRSHELGEEEWDRVMDINLKSVFLGIKYAVPEMIKNGGGAIVNTASLLGLKGQKYLSAYNASKGGVVLLTKNAALEYGKYGIRVNAVAPGVIDTQMIEGWRQNEWKWPIISKANALRRIGRPREVSKAILFLASDDASFITGVTLSVDGGGHTY